MSRPQTIRGKDDSGKLASSRPIEIPSDRRSATDKARGFAQSCPTFRPPPPPPPSTRPQIPSVEPPPLDLPPSPSFNEELKEESPTGGVSVITSGARPLTANAAAHRSYARSLMLSSSLPTTSFLDSYKWQAVAEQSDSPALYDEDGKDGEESEEKVASPPSAGTSDSPPQATRAAAGSLTGRNRGGSTADDTAPGSYSTSLRRPINIGAHSASGSGSGHGAADDLSKSPTVLSLLQSNSFTNSPQVSYRSSRATHMDTRASVLAKSKAQKADDEEEEEGPEDNAADDLQFSISLNENDESYLDGADEGY